MNFNKGKVRDIYLLTTDVENMFINEYMPGAPGDYVKVYLYGLLYAQHEGEMTHEALARHLRLSAETVEEAWNYWAQMGVVKKIPCPEGGLFSFDVEFVSIREKMYGNVPKEESEETGPDMGKAAVLVDKSMKELYGKIEEFLGRLLAPEENQEISGWIKNDGMSHDLVREAFRYCCGRGQSSLRYIAKVAFSWNEKGLRQKDEILEYIENLDERYDLYKSVLGSLGLKRNVTKAEKEMIDSWVDGMGFSKERIMAACDTTLSAANPNLRYVNKVLENWRNEAAEQGRDVNQKVTVTQAVLNKYYEFLREEAEAAAEARLKEVYEAVPQIAEIDQRLKDLGSKLSRGLLSGMTRAQIEEIRTKIRQDEEERAVLLTENNFSVEYTDIKYSCDKCGDTGIDENGQRCSCTKARTGEAEIWQKTRK
ncbi:MAG: DnaD domain protein [Firmicutes bacterium]|nr:DnaD domain protein [Bacillota bacterium]